MSRYQKKLSFHAVLASRLSNKYNSLTVLKKEKSPLARLSNRILSLQGTKTRLIIM